MCIFPNTASRISVLVAIPITIAVHIAEIVFAIFNLQSPGAPEALFYLYVSACLVLVAGLCVGFYGTLYRKLALLRVMLFLIVVTIVVKVFIWIICVNKGNNYDKFITIIWFKIGLACAVICFLATVIYCLRLRDIGDEDGL